MKLGIILTLCSLVVAGALGWYFWQPESAVEPPTVAGVEADPILAKAIEEARTAIKNSPRSAQAWGHLGMVLLAHAIYPEAEVCLAQAVKLDPQDGRWAYFYGLTLIRTNPEIGIPQLQRAVQLCGNSEAPRLKLAEVLLGEGRLDEAEKHFRAVLEYDPGNPHSELGLGRLAHERGNWEESLHHLRRSAQRAPGVRATHVLLAQVYQRLGDNAAADKEQEWITKNPDGAGWPDPYADALRQLKTDVHTRINLAEILFNQGKRQEAIAMAQETVRDHPRSDGAHLDYGILLLRTDLLAEAEGELREAVRLRPDSIATQSALGLALLRRGKFPEAMDCYRAALKLNPQYAIAHYNLGVCLRHLGDKPAAVQEFETAVKCKPDFALAHRDLAAMLIEQGKFVEAAGHLQDAVRLDPADEVAKNLLERVRQEKDRSEKR